MAQYHRNYARSEWRVPLTTATTVEPLDWTIHSFFSTPLGVGRPCIAFRGLRSWCLLAVRLQLATTSHQETLTTTITTAIETAADNGREPPCGAIRPFKITKPS